METKRDGFADIDLSGIQTAKPDQQHISVLAEHMQARVVVASDVLVYLLQTYTTYLISLSTRPRPRFP
jgi:hypothetical protein